VEPSKGSPQASDVDSCVHTVKRDGREYTFACFAWRDHNSPWCSSTRGILAIPRCSHNVFVLTCPNGQRWSLRIAKDEFAASLAEQSVSIINHISKKRPSLSIPAIVHHDEGYAVLKYLEGAAIGSWNSNTLSDHIRHKVLDRLASFLYRLWTCPAPVTESGEGVEPGQVYNLVSG